MAWGDGLTLCCARWPAEYKRCVYNSAAMGAAAHGSSPAASAAQASATVRLGVTGLPVVRLLPATHSAYVERLTPRAWAAVSYV